MLRLNAEQAPRLLPDTLTIPGAVIATPPLPEDRIDTYSPAAEAYRRPANGERRTPAEIAQDCLPNTNEPLMLHDFGGQTRFRLRRDFGDLALRHITEAIENPGYGLTPLYRVAHLLPSVPSPETRRELAFGIVNHDTASDYTKQVVARFVPEATGYGDFVFEQEGAYKPDPRVIAKGQNREKDKVTMPKGLRNLAQTLQVKLNPKYLTSSPLHSRAGDGVEKFRKTGPETFVLPKDLEASVRVIPITAAAEWKKAFESVEKWYELGFNYIPVEPILGVAATEESDMVAMTAASLRGRSLHSREWQA